MKYLSLIVVILSLVGCTVDADPMRVADAKVKTGQSDIAVSQNNAQISQAQQADADARRAQDNLQALQERNAIVQGQSIIASSSMVSGIVASNNQTMLVLADKMIEASRPDYTPLYVLFAVLAVVVVIVVVIVARMNVAMAQAAAQPNWRALPSRSPASMLPPPRVVEEAEKRGAMAIWEPNGAYWTLVNQQTGQTWTQRKQIGGQ